MQSSVSTSNLASSRMQAAVRSAAIAHIFPRTSQILKELGAEKFLFEACDAKDFPKKLSNRKWPNQYGALPDLALIEWHLAWSAKFDGEVGGLGFDRVPTATEPEWYQARFRFRSSLKVIESEWAVPQYWVGLPALRQTTSVLLFRSPKGAVVRSVSENEKSLLEALSLGVPLGVILEKPRGPEFDAFLFHDWIHSGLLLAIDWAGA